MKKHYNLITSILFLIILAVIPYIFGGASPDRKFSHEDPGLTKDYIAKHPKYDSPELFAEYHSMIRMRDGEEAPAYPANYQLIELEKALARKPNTHLSPLAGIEWIERGPSNVGGRSRAVVVDPADRTKGTWFAASVGGGIWKTTNMGLTWDNKTPDLPNIAFSTLVQAKSNPDILYAGSGEGFKNLDAVNGKGVFKSTDRGETWKQLEQTVPFQSINRVIVHPENHDIVLFCSNNMKISNSGGSNYYNNESYIVKSTDGGTSWKVVYAAGNRPVQQLLPDPQDFNTIYASVNSRGILKSINMGETWTWINNGFEGGGRIEMAIAPTNTDKLYLSVQNGYRSDFYYTANGGNRWYFVNDTSGNNLSWLGSQGWYDNTIAVHPFNENIVYTGGINLFKTTMQPGTDSVFKILDVTHDNLFSYIRPFSRNFSNWYSAVGKGSEYWGSAVASDDEHKSVRLMFGEGFSQKAMRYAGEDTLFYEDYIEVPFKIVDVKTGKKLMASFYDEDGSGEFNLAPGHSELIFVHSLDHSPVVDDAFKNKNGASYRNTYVISLRANDGVEWDPAEIPESSLLIEWGAYYTKRRYSEPVTDGYRQFPQFNNPNNNSVLHVDHHYLHMEPVNENTGEYLIIDCNDGGLGYSTDEGASWTETDKNGYNTTQFYGCDKCPGEDRFVGGTQDNGSWMTPGGVVSEASSSYEKAAGGDGFEASWHYGNPDKIAVTSQFNVIYKTTNGGRNWEPAINGLTDIGSGRGIFVTKIAKSQSDPELLFTVGKSGVWRSDNFANYWTPAEIPDSNWASGGYISNAQIDISIADPQVVWAGVYMSDRGKINLSTDGGLTFNAVNNYEGREMGRVTGIETHPTQKETAFILFSFPQSPKILRTDDYGETWTDISGFGQDTVSSGGFPDVAVYSLVVMPFNDNIIWAGTEIGIFETTDGGQNWHYAGNELPAVSVWQLRIVDDQVVAATHGRGIWSVKLSALEGYEPADVILTPIIDKLGQNPRGNLVVKANLRDDYDSTAVFVNGEPEGDAIRGEKGERMIEIPYQVEEEEETVEIQLRAYKKNREYQSAIISHKLYPIGDPQVTYSTDFEDENGFGINGFFFLQPNGFDSKSLNSNHPYWNSFEATALLLTPIIVADENDEIKYRDIAIIEPGEEGSVFGDAEFFDYVIIEATLNGLDWYPVMDGYDATLYEDWTELFGSRKNPDKSNLKQHNYTLQNENISGRDTILLRLKLFSDPGLNGWGWLVDDLSIQENGIVSVETSHQSNLEILNIYPNPVVSKSKIEFMMIKYGNVVIDLTDLAGRKVKTLYSNYLQPGIHTVDFYPGNLPGGNYFIRLRTGNNTDVRRIAISR